MSPRVFLNCAVGQAAHCASLNQEQGKPGATDGTELRKPLSNSDMLGKWYLRVTLRVKGNGEGEGGKPNSLRQQQHPYFLYSTILNFVDSKEVVSYFQNVMIKALRKLLMGKVNAWFWAQRWAFGLKNTRLKDWWGVVVEEDVKFDWRAWLKMGMGAIHTTVFAPTDFQRFQKRLRICAACPVKEPGFWRCRPYTGSTAGCGCYIPFIAKGKRECWAYERNPLRGWGPSEPANRSR